MLESEDYRCERCAMPLFHKRSIHGDCRILKNPVPFSFRRSGYGSFVQPRMLFFLQFWLSSYLAKVEGGGQSIDVGTAAWGAEICVGTFL